MKKIRLLALALSFVVLFSVAFTGCQKQDEWIYESIWYDADGNVLSSSPFEENNESDNSESVSDNNESDKNETVSENNESDKNENVSENNESNKNENDSNKNESEKNNESNKDDKSENDSNNQNLNMSDKVSDKDAEKGIKIDPENGVTYMDDDLDDWGKVYERGSDLQFDDYAAGMFDNDFSRVIRKDPGKECWFTYKYEKGIEEVGIINFPSFKNTQLDVYVSKDNKTWTKLENPKVASAPIHSEWDKMVIRYYGIDPANIYLKIDLSACNRTSKHGLYAPNVGRVRINNVDKIEDPNRYLEGRESATFYVDSKSGSDNNDGMSPENAFKSLNKISKKYFQPGDKILFKAGQKFNGSVKINGSGSKDNPITVGTYGGNEKAKIVARGGNAVNIKSSNITIENLEITNPNGMAGIYFVANNTGKNDNITVRNCHIYKVNTKQESFEPGDYDHGGIIFSINGIDPTWLDNVLIENNVIEETSRCGILLSTDWAYRPARWGKEGYYKSDDDGWYPAENVVIKNNTVTKCYGDSILILGAKGAVIEKNTVTESFNQSKVQNIACAAVWTSNTNDTKVQYNDVSYTKLPAGCNDGEVFDIDIAEKRTIIQYNYTHDNEGGFLLMCSSEEALESGIRYGDHKVRFNLSVNDGRASKSHGVFMIDSENPGTHIYNNTIYMTDECTNPIRQYFRTTADFTFTNNIFYGTGKTYEWHTSGGWKNTLFDNNVFYNAGLEHLKKQAGITVKNEKTEDPKFKNPDIDTSKASREEAIKAFTPKNKIKGATDINDNGGKDINGNKFSKIDFYGCIKY